YVDEYAKLSQVAGIPGKKERMIVLGFRSTGSMLDKIQKILTTGVNNDNIKLNNRDVRNAYKKAVSGIYNRIDMDGGLEFQARQAFEMRNKYRTIARSLMDDTQAKEQLDKLRPNKEFDELLLDKMKRKKLSKEEALQDILVTAVKTNKKIDDHLL
ncbi:MAG: hypothetical protein RR396_06465, partial [Clostridiales bacterium]